MLPLRNQINVMHGTLAIYELSFQPLNLELISNDMLEMLLTLIDTSQGRG